MTGHTGLSRRTFLHGTMAAGGALVIAGCGGGSSGSGGKNGAAKLLAGGGRWEKGGFGWNQVHAFNKKHGADVQVVSASQDLVKLFSQQAAAGTFPDLLTGATIPLSTMLAHDWALSIGDLGVDISGRFPKTMWVDGITTADKKIYSWQSDDARGHYFASNTAYLQDAGISKPPKTWDELIGMASTIKKKHKNVYGIALPLNGGGGFSLLGDTTQPSNLANVAGFDLHTGKYALDKFYAPTMDLFIKLNKTGVLHPNSPQLSFADSDGYFNSGRTAFTLSGTWLCSVNHERKFSDYVVSPLPTVSSGAESVLYGSLAATSFYVLTSSKAHDVNKEFVDYFTSESYIKALLVQNYSLSANTDLNQKFAPNAQMKQLIATQSTIRQPPIPEADAKALAAKEAEAALPAPRQSADDVAAGVLAGKIDDWKGALAKVNEDFNNRFDQALKKAKCPRAKFVFTDWNGTSDYPVSSSVR